MRRPGPVSLALLLWLATELVAFVLVVHLAGLTGAILLGLLTSLAGVATLRRVGLDAARALRQAMKGAELAEGAMLDGTLSALGSVLLIIPGFVTDLAGFALLAPSVRQWLAA